MPDGWEIDYGLNPLMDDSAQDPDLDGASNLIECRGGSDPQVYNSPPVTSCAAPAYSNQVAVTIIFTANNPLTDVSLYASFNNSPYYETGLKQTGASGSFNYSFPYGEGTYRFFTLGKLYLFFQEGMPTSTDAVTIYDVTKPISEASSGLAYSTLTAPLPIGFNCNEPLSTVSLWYRINNGAWTDSGLAEVGDSGFFSFLPSSEGRYDFYTIAQDPATNLELPNPWADASTIVDGSNPVSFTVADGEDLLDDDFGISTTRLSATWTPASDPQSGIARYEYAIGTTPAGTQIKGWTNAYLATTMTATGLSLAEGQTVFTTVRAFNGAGLYTQVNSNGVKVDTRAPEIAGSNPTDSEHIGSSLPTITVEFADAGAGLDPASLTYQLDFQTVNPSDYT